MSRVTSTASASGAPDTPASDLRLRNIAALVGLVGLPILLYAVMLQTFWSRGELGIDLTQTLLPAAREIADGNSPYPAYGYPPLVAFVLVPLTVVPSPELVYTAALLAGIPASLWVLRVRDWRCYGAAFLWGATFHAVQTGNVSIPLLLLTALAWRARESARAGAWAGLAIATKLDLLAARRVAGRTTQLRDSRHRDRGRSRRHRGALGKPRVLGARRLPVEPRQARDGTGAVELHTPCAGRRSRRTAARAGGVVGGRPRLPRRMRQSPDAVLTIASPSRWRSSSA